MEGHELQRSSPYTPGFAVYDNLFVAIRPWPRERWELAPCL
jgi:hypothetical protein